MKSKITEESFVTFTVDRDTALSLNELLRAVLVPNIVTEGKVQVPELWDMLPSLCSDDRAHLGELAYQLGAHFGTISTA